MQVAQGNLVLIGLNTLEPKVFWNGTQLEFVVDIATNWDTEEPKVKFRVSQDSPLAVEMRAAGIKIKVGEAK